MKIDKNKSIKYLYDVNAPIWKELLWCNALELRIVLGNKLLTKLLNKKRTAKVEYRMKDVIEAIEFNKKRLAE